MCCVSVIVVVLLILASTILNDSGPFGSSSLYDRSCHGVPDMWITFMFVSEQHDMARASTRLAFYIETLHRYARSDVTCSRSSPFSQLTG